MKVTCPSCRKEIEYSVDNPYRPFCSKRCKESDLFEWLVDNESEEDELMMMEPEDPADGFPSRSRH